MPGFKEARRALGRKPARVQTYPSSIFADTWAGRPTSDVAVGLRVPSDHQVSLARANAARLAVELHPRPEDVELRVASMNDALMREVCAMVMCDANNAHEPYFRAQEDDVATKLTSEGVKRIFDDFERLVLETSPVHREIEDDEIDLLAARLTPEALAVMTTSRARRARRLMSFLLDELGAPEAP